MTTIKPTPPVNLQDHSRGKKKKKRHYDGNRSKRLQMQPKVPVEDDEPIDENQPSFYEDLSADIQSNRILLEIELETGDFDRRNRLSSNIQRSKPPRVLPTAPNLAGNIEAGVVNPPSIPTQNPENETSKDQINQSIDPGRESEAGNVPGETEKELEDDATKLLRRKLKREKKAERLAFLKRARIDRKKARKLAEKMCKKRQREKNLFKKIAKDDETERILSHQPPPSKNDGKSGLKKGEFIDNLDFIKLDPSNDNSSKRRKISDERQYPERPRGRRTVAENRESSYRSSVRPTNSTYFYNCKNDIDHNLIKNNSNHSHGKASSSGYLINSKNNDNSYSSNNVSYNQTTFKDDRNEKRSHNHRDNHNHADVLHDDKNNNNNNNNRNYAIVSNDSTITNSKSNHGIINTSANNHSTNTNVNSNNNNNKENNSNTSKSSTNDSNRDDSNANNNNKNHDGNDNHNNDNTNSNNNGNTHNNLNNNSSNGNNKEDNSNTDNNNNSGANKNNDSGTNNNNDGHTNNNNSDNTNNNNGSSNNSDNNGSNNSKNNSSNNNNNNSKDNSSKDDNNDTESSKNNKKDNDDVQSNNENRGEFVKNLDFIRLEGSDEERSDPTSNNNLQERFSSSRGRNQIENLNHNNNNYNSNEIQNNNSNNNNNKRGTKRKFSEGREEESNFIRKKKGLIVTPWFQSFKDWKNKDVQNMLTTEIASFVSYIRPKPEEDELRFMVIEMIRRTVQQRWSDADVEPFGSYGTKLYLPGGDIDLVILSTKMMNEQRSKILYRLAPLIRQNNIGKDVVVISRAKVPIIKFKTIFGDFNVDISINQSNGLIAMNKVNQLLEEIKVKSLDLCKNQSSSNHNNNRSLKSSSRSYPSGRNSKSNNRVDHHQRSRNSDENSQIEDGEVEEEEIRDGDEEEEEKRFREIVEDLGAGKCLVLVIKSILKQRGMNEVYSGGLGSYSIICLVVSFLQMHPKIQRGDIDPNKNLGVLLLEFFELYGKHYNFNHTGISLSQGGYYFNKSKRGWQKERQPNLLCIEDPADENNDIAVGSHNILGVRSVFSGAFDLLSATLYYRHSLQVSRSASSYSTSTSSRSRPLLSVPTPSTNLDESSKLESKDPLEQSLLGEIMGVTKELVDNREKNLKLYYNGTLQRMLNLPPPPPRKLNDSFAGSNSISIGKHTGKEELTSKQKRNRTRDQRRKHKDREDRAGISAEINNREDDVRTRYDEPDRRNRTEIRSSSKVEKSNQEGSIFSSRVGIVKSRATGEPNRFNSSSDYARGSASMPYEVPDDDNDNDESEGNLNLYQQQNKKSLKEPNRFESDSRYEVIKTRTKRSFEGDVNFAGGGGVESGSGDTSGSISIEFNEKDDQEEQGKSLEDFEKEKGLVEFFEAESEGESSSVIATIEDQLVSAKKPKLDGNNKQKRNDGDDKDEIVIGSSNHANDDKDKLESSKQEPVAANDDDDNV